jgi:Sec-independent protein translocase protein TatA
VGFGSELLFVFVLGFLLLGPKKLPALLRRIARVKAQLKQATHGLTAELDAALEPHKQPEMNSQATTGGQQ